jgi:hypothetical protein
MKSVFLLEDCDSSFLSRCKEGNVISLQPAVSYFLHKNNIKYQILSDYYDEEELSLYGDSYFFEQFKWFDSFDNFLKENITYCKKYNIPIAKANYLRLKYFVDVPVIYSYILSAFFNNNADIKQIVYVRRPYIGNNRYSIFEFKYKSRNVFYDLLKLYCKKNGIQIVDQIVGKEERQSQKYCLNTNAGNRFAKSQIKKFINIVKYEKLKGLFTLDTSLKGMNILFMHAGSIDIDYPAKEVLKYKAHVYVIENGRVFREDSLLRKQVDIPELDESFLRSLKEENETCANNLDKDNEIIFWINNKCSLDISSTLLPFLKYFISKECFYTLQDAERMFNFYNQNDIDYVFARGSTDMDSLGPLIAAKYMKGAKSICTQHASFAVDSKTYGVYETEPYNCIITRDDISQKYYEYSSRTCKTGCEVVQSPYFLRSVRNKYSKKNKGGKVIYIQKKFNSGLMIRCLNQVTCALDWYFEYQRALIDVFTEEANFEFVYKHAQDQKWAEDSILRYIEDKGCENINVSKKQFLMTLESADRVITDIPFGAFFEAIVSGKPVLCICPDYYKMIEDAKITFGKSLQQFSSIKEAKIIIKEFLYGNPNEYIVDIPMSDNDFIDTFKEIQKSI